MIRERVLRGICRLSHMGESARKPSRAHGQNRSTPFLAAILTMLACAAGSPGRAAEPPAAYAYIGGPYIITAEVSGAHKFVLNFFNLSEFVIVVQPGEFIYKGRSGQFYIGQVFDLPTKGTRGESYRYSASVLLNSYTYKGLDILGAFHEQDSVEELSIRFGAKRYFLAPLTKAQFNELGSKIEDLDLRNTDPQAAMRNAGLTEIGRVTINDGTSEWDRDWQGLLYPEDVNPPRILESPEVTPTEEARRTNTYGKVKLSGVITRDGTIRELSVVKGLGRGLDERAIAAVKTGWIFLPATKNGEVIETIIKFDVTISPPKNH
jgi:hypothetical protein